MNKRETVQESEKFVNIYRHTHTHTHCTGLLPPPPVTPSHTIRVPSARPEANGADRRLTLPSLPASPYEVCVCVCVCVCARARACVSCGCRVFCVTLPIPLRATKGFLFSKGKKEGFLFSKGRKKMNHVACGCKLAHAWF